MGLLIYEKEFLAILLAVSKWKHYLSPRQFIIKTDHQSLKHLLEQKITTAVQQKGMVKLMGLDYVIHYKAGRENRATDALSRRGFEEGTSSAISTAIPSWVTDVAASYQGDDHYEKVIAGLLLQPNQHSKYNYKQGLLRYKGRICVGSQGNSRESILSQLHSALGGHSGALRTYKRIKQYFHWPGLKQDAAKHAKD